MGAFHPTDPPILFRRRHTPELHLHPLPDFPTPCFSTPPPPPNVPFNFSDMPSGLPLPLTIPQPHPTPFAPPFGLLSPPNTPCATPCATPFAPDQHHQQAAWHGPHGLPQRAHAPPHSHPPAAAAGVFFPAGAASPAELQPAAPAAPPEQLCGLPSSARRHPRYWMYARPGEQRAAFAGRRSCAREMGGQRG